MILGLPPFTGRAMPKLAGLIVLLGSTAWAAPNHWTGSYRGAELGAIELRTEGARVSGKYKGGGACPFEVDQQVLSGQLEGNVLVGSLLVCQQGAACGQKVYPVLAFYSDGKLWADVKLDAGCSSPALRDGRLQLTASPDDRTARKKPNTKRVMDLHKRALLEGKRLFEAGDYAGAAQQFEIGITFNEENWAAYLVLGIAEFKRGNVIKAIGAYERARELARDAGLNEPDIYYNLACAYSRLGDRQAAINNLKQAIKNGFGSAELMNSDEDLNALFKDDPEFRRLVQQASAVSKGKKGEGKL